jgi:hypothetical protein
MSRAGFGTLVRATRNARSNCCCLVFQQRMGSDFLESFTKAMEAWGLGSENRKRARNSGGRDQSSRLDCAGMGRSMLRPYEETPGAGAGVRTALRKAGPTEKGQLKMAACPFETHGERHGATGRKKLNRSRRYEEVLMGRWADSQAARPPAISATRANLARWRRLAAREER